MKWIGDPSGWHGLAKPEGGTQPDWTTRSGQYTHAYPQREAKLDAPLDQALLDHWSKVLPVELREPAAGMSVDGNFSRDEALRTLHRPR